MENTKKIQETLMNAIFEVFEKMFFVFLEPIDEEIKYDMVSTINFTGPMSGSFNIMLAKGLGESIVQNMLGVETADVTDKLIEDCAKEAANMVSGNFLQKYDSSKVFDLSIPAFRKESGVSVIQEEGAGPKVFNLSFDSNEGPMAVKMVIA